MVDLPKILIDAIKVECPVGFYCSWEKNSNFPKMFAIKSIEDIKPLRKDNKKIGKKFRCKKLFLCPEFILECSSASGHSCSSCCSLSALL